MIWSIRSGDISLEFPLVMGVLNITPDSFSDGGRYFEWDASLRRAEELLADGADILDVGGVSTRPGADDVDEAEELRRVVPLIRELRKRFSTPLSVDTFRASVAEAALGEGADIVNDVSALSDPAMAGVVAGAGAGVVLMHTRGSPRTMSRENVYSDLPREVASELSARVERALEAGVPRGRICLDPGFGFAKVGMQNYELLRGLGAVLGLGLPVLVGASRKSFIGQAITARRGCGFADAPEPFRPAGERLAGSLAFAVAAVWLGARILRVHDVSETCDALKVALNCMSNEGR